ncbi:MAG TPA: potassium/proton antiporter [Gammaproteobacteria bacterium]|nr:potassium/proton antiporter [Gammaproteobacteria bacterium]HPQ25666.1 potassium/proton antiporter [Gammaproteobacteria bacterium]
METAGSVIALVSLLFLISVLSTALTPRLGIPVLLLYLGVGMLAGENGLLGIRYDDVDSAYLIGSAALAVILFDGGLRTDPTAFRVALAPALSLATLGVLLTAGIIGAFAVLALDLGWMEALLLGAIIGSTDAAAVFSLLHGRGMLLKERVGATLEIESGINDPMAVFLTLLLVEAVTSNDAPGWGAVLSFFWQMGGGAAIGLAAGASLAWAVTRIVLNAALYPLLVLFGALFAFGIAALLDTSGFLAVYLAGLTMAGRVSRGLYNIQRFVDGAAWLSQISMFLVLGLLVTPTNLIPHAPAALLIGLALIFVARPLAVIACLAPFRFAWREQLFISWVGLRGAVPIILAMFPWIAGFENWQTYFNVAFFVVLVSLLVQGWTVTPLARWTGLEVPSRTGRLQRVELGMPGQEEVELVGYRIERDSPLLGASPALADWPGDTRALLVIRKGKAIKIEELGSLEDNDQLYFLARPVEMWQLDRRILAEREPQRLGERAFFGDFVVKPDATLGALDAVYRFGLDPADASLTISEFLLRRYPRPVVGDRVRLGSIEFVVRRVAGNRITQVGLKLRT